MLFAREPSGIYEPRRRAVEALAQLGAYDDLIEYLRVFRVPTDPIEQVGEEAVINAAARAVVKSGRLEVVPILLEWARRKPLAGVVDALGALRRTEAIQFLVDALAEDSTRPAAEKAIRAIGPVASRILLKTALRRSAGTEEATSRKRQRLSALKTLGELATPSSETLGFLRQLVGDSDPKIATAACGICLANDGHSGKVAAVLRLVDLLSFVDWPMSEEIETHLHRHIAFAEPIVRDYLRLAEREIADVPQALGTLVTLRRVLSRVSESRDKVV